MAITVRALLISLLTSVLWICPAAAQEVFCFLLPYGTPTGTPDTNILVVREIYALSANPATKFADWVAYRLDSTTISGNARTSRNWAADPWLPADATLEPADYRNAAATLHVDRGHQAPLASFKGTRYWNETNNLSNITPQRADLNQGPWNALEEQERRLARRGGTVYVITGPLYERAMRPLPMADEPHTVPSGYWKIVAIADTTGTLQCSAYIFAQETPRNDAVRDHLCTVDEIETRSGLDFFVALDDESEARLEASRAEIWKLVTQEAVSVTDSDTGAGMSGE